MCVTTLLCGPWANLWLFYYMGCTVNGLPFWNSSEPRTLKRLCIESLCAVGVNSYKSKTNGQRKKPLLVEWWLRFRFFYDLFTFDPCFLLLPIVYALRAMFFFPECNVPFLCQKVGWVCPSDVYSTRIISLLSFQTWIKSVTVLVWKRPVFQSQAYWRLHVPIRNFLDV